MDCRVLILDDDPACLLEYAEMVEALGYACVTASDAPTALRLITRDPGIGIVLTDMHMPAMDGLTFLEEVSARFAFVRPIAAVMITGHGSLETAVQAMRSQAIDFLAKPVSQGELSAALKRASMRWAQLYGKQQLARIDRAAQAEELSPPMEAQPAEPEELGKLIRSIIKSRRQRAQIFDTDLFADPAWDILLDLTSARIEGRPVPVSSACAAAAIPLTTALRWIGHLVEAGLIRRWQDPTDKRRNLVEIEDEAFKAMTRYVVATHARNALPPKS